MPAGDRVLRPVGLAFRAADGVSMFAGDISNAPRSYAERFFDVGDFVEHEAGGHFAAWEQPVAYASDLRLALSLAEDS